MRKALLVLVAAVSLTSATITAPGKAQAGGCHGCWGWAAGGLALGLIGSAIVANNAYGYGYGGYGGYGYGYPYYYGGYAQAYYPAYAYTPYYGGYGYGGYGGYGYAYAPYRYAYAPYYGGYGYGYRPWRGYYGGARYYGARYYGRGYGRGYYGRGYYGGYRRAHWR